MNTYLNQHGEMKEHGRDTEASREQLCALLPWEVCRGSVEMVVFDMNPGLTSWCIWKCRQEASSSRGYKDEQRQGG